MEISQMLDLAKQTAKDLGFPGPAGLTGEGNEVEYVNLGEEVDYSGCGPEFTRTASRDRKCVIAT